MLILMRDDGVADEIPARKLISRFGYSSGGGKGQGESGKGKEKKEENND